VVVTGKSRLSIVIPYSKWKGDDTVACDMNGYHIWCQYVCFLSIAVVDTLKQTNSSENNYLDNQDRLEKVAFWTAISLGDDA
jgi:hypothetical protein